MPAALNSTQLEILKLFRSEQSEEELQEIKALLISYLSNKVVSEADKVSTDRKYTSATFESWKDDHFRKKE